MSEYSAGDRVAHFRVVEKLGEGGMGVVYRALDEKLRREVALKVLPTGLAADPERRHRFLREARAAGALTHPNIATVYEVGAEGEVVYIAMELISGMSLRALLASRRLSIDESLRIARRILRALTKAHENGVVHRDLKPDNVMVTDDDEVKLLDFGLAKIDAETTASSATQVGSGDTEMAATQEGRVLGSPLYMSPEQAAGTSLDHRTDLFSFGIVVYEMLTGLRPFGGTSLVEVVIAISRDEPEPLSKRAPAASAELSAVVERCLRKRPDERFGSAREVLTALEHVTGPVSLVGQEAFGVTELDAAPIRAALPTLPETGAKDAAIATARARFSPIWGAGLALVVVAAVIAGARLRTGTPVGAAAAPSASVSASAVAVTDLPIPDGAAPDAVAAYRAAMQSLRDGNYEACTSGLREALRISPGMAVAELRLAFALLTTMRMISEAREHLQKAGGLRATLSPRDRVFLDALDPAINREPPDVVEYEKRLNAAIAAYPRDAELLYALGLVQHAGGRPSEAMATYDRALDTDGRFMAALRMRAQVQRFTRDYPGARRSIDACLSTLPTATGCIGERLSLDSEEGLCEQVELDAQQIVAADAKSYRGYIEWARAAAYLGRPEGSVDELLKQAWARAPEAMRVSEEPANRAALATLSGRFDDADAVLRGLETSLATNTSASTHGGARRYRVELAQERGDLKGAGALAADFLSRQIAWSGQPDWVSVTMLWAQHLGGTTTRQAFALAQTDMIAREAQRSQTFPLSAAESWVLHHAVATASPDDARDALAHLPPGTDPVTTGAFVPFWGANIGRTLLLAGRIDEAITSLRRATRLCAALADPTNHVHARLYLAQALEAKGDRDGACVEYAAVIARWGAAKPRSVSASTARARSAALSCPR